MLFMAGLMIGVVAGAWYGYWYGRQERLRHMRRTR